jgi:hypothetical protein
VRVHDGLQRGRRGAAEADQQHRLSTQAREEQRQFEVGTRQEGRDQLQPERGHQVAVHRVLRQRQQQGFIQPAGAAGQHRLQQHAQCQQHLARRAAEACLRQHGIEAADRLQFEEVVKLAW